MDHSEVAVIVQELVLEKQNSGMSILPAQQTKVEALVEKLSLDLVTVATDQQLQDALAKAGFDPQSGWTMTEIGQVITMIAAVFPLGEDQVAGVIGNMLR